MSAVAALDLDALDALDLDDVDLYRLAELPERIASKVEVRHASDVEGITSPCWVWTGARRSGYGRVWWDGRMHSAHRVVYALLVGDIPADRPQLDHLCRVRHCVRPDHLEPVDNRTNVLRGESPTAVAHVTGRCASGRHDLVGDNVSVLSNGGGRLCRACRNERYRAYRARRRAAAGAQLALPV